ncbi:MAG: hypothetical protein ABIR28_11275, partial [Vicinamibacteria bacterium]
IRQRKLSFFLTRPCAPWQIWLGRLTGAAAIVGVGWVGVLATVPFSDFSRDVFPLIMAVVLAGVLLAMNAMVMILAANSPRWFVADVVAAMILVAGAAWSLEQTLRIGDFALMVEGIIAIVAGAMAAQFLGGLAFLAAGHGDGPSGHRAHSLTWWSLGVLVLAGLGAQRAYEWNRSLGSMLAYPNAKSVGPTQTLVSTFPKRRGASYLLDTRTGQSQRVSAFMAWRSIHPGGSGVVGFVEPDIGRAREKHLVITPVDLGRPPIADLPFPESWGTLTDIASNGELAIFSTYQGLSVIRTQTGTKVFDAPGRNVHWAQFQTPSTIVTLDSDTSGPRLRILGLEGKVVEERAFPVTAADWYLTVHADSGRVVVTQPLIGVTLYGRGGRVVASVPANQQIGHALSVSPQGVLMTHAGDCLVLGGSGLRLIRHDESTVHDVPFLLEGVPIALAGVLDISGELASGEVMINQYELAQNSVLLVDPLTGVIRLRLKGFKTPAVRDWRGVVPAGEPTGDSALRLLSSDDHDLFFLDPGSAAPRLLVKNTREDR